MGRSPTPSVLCALAFYFVFLLGLDRLVQIVRAQIGATPPSEVRALNSVFNQWGLSLSSTNYQWNISGETCSGAAIDTSILWDIFRTDYNPGIRCDCNGTVCHITQFKVFDLDVTGGIPEELWSLTSLTHLNLGKNYLTGPVSSSIAKLTQMQWLNLGFNALSGEVPKELGKLTNLTVLRIRTNNFSGSLPSELGNLIKLQDLFFDSSGVSGAIPSTFAALQNLTTVLGSNNELTGRIPKFIGNWSKLSNLRFQGNAFEGGIPSIFSKLTSLTDLRISDLSNGSSSLTFLNDMTSLTLSTLILRNNNISGTIPSNIGDFPSLSQLDLSFNNLTGPIPDSLFNLRSLSYLFLGNNKLTGMLPTTKSPSLLHIDVSYNQLVGELPSWANNSVLATGLDCIQQNFPCLGDIRSSPKYSDFAINCGGPEMTSSSQIVYEGDNDALGPATYYEASTKRWAVSNVGGFSDNTDLQYTSVSSSQVITNLDSRLFLTARLSPGSLRYFGLGLDNGNYNVTLYFAETEFLNPPTWKSLGRRVFDIYIQGNLVWKDFEIKKEAGGVSLQIQKVFPAQVSKNYLEIHLFWAGKGTCCVPVVGTFGPSISAISAVPDFIPTIRKTPTSGKKSKIGLIVGIVVPVGVVSFLSFLALYWFVLCRKRPGWDDDEELLRMDVRPCTISYAELKAATKDFNPTNKLGEGGFGPVFKGTLNDGRVIAVKQLSVASHQGKDQFVAEIATTSAVQHRNLVKLYGCCIEGNKRLIVYEYLENKSLDQALFAGKTSLFLNWPIRFDICLGVARGLAYLHVESRLRIVHRDVKASNILLDSDLNPKVSDFGLAKLFDDKKTHISTRVAGTFGYLAPEYAMLGQLTEKADVFGFGVVALEIVSGRPNTDSSLEEEKIYLLKWAWHVHENNREVELVDARLLEFEKEEVKRVIRVALLCTQTSPQQRPSMPRVVAMLSGDIEVSAVTSRPRYFTDWNFDTTSFMTTDTPSAENEHSQFSSSTSRIFQVQRT
ncbi:probable LRR receptor-like serine/threonine-protein kinase At1g56140 isoform X5 [Rhododendron vialii]|uniref:probable LRR receptor-like serine/threonine-protein kinase At1g56140 isoform X5 n=1 Tax=Rhododendron vialii TaxID=182163 RepID=UPI00265F6BA4|nr:probable LRR receptor-like serine/threonine-protein kinase At1g56140 isoform X5 [Rhododendron vialii]